MSEITFLAALNSNVAAVHFLRRICSNYLRIIITTTRLTPRINFFLAQLIKALGFFLLINFKMPSTSMSIKNSITCLTEPVRKLDSLHKIV